MITLEELKAAASAPFDPMFGSCWETDAGGCPALCVAECRSLEVRLEEMTGLPREGPDNDHVVECFDELQDYMAPYVGAVTREHAYPVYDYAGLYALDDGKELLEEAFRLAIADLERGEVS